LYSINVSLQNLLLERWSDTVPLLKTNCNRCSDCIASKFASLTRWNDCIASKIFKKGRPKQSKDWCRYQSMGPSELRPPLTPTKKKGKNPEELIRDYRMATGKYETCLPFWDEDVPLPPLPVWPEPRIWQKKSKPAAW